MSHHSPIMDFTYTQIMLKPFKTKISMFFKFYFIKLYIYITTYLHQMKMSPKVTNTHLRINKKIK